MQKISQCTFLFQLDGTVRLLGTLLYFDQKFQLRSSSFRDLAVAVRTRTDIKRKSQYKVKLNLITASSGTKK